MTAYYNEIDPFAAQWLRTLITQGHLPRGDVDERSIEDVKPDDLTTYTQCHFFAGIGVWAYALRLAGWDDDRPVWTGSCPCQPFSAAGKGTGFDDERHLWPAWAWLIEQRRPSVIFGEQVERAIAFGWNDDVFSRLESLDYAIGSAVLGGVMVGSPQGRPRTYFSATSNSTMRLDSSVGSQRNVRRLETQPWKDVEWHINSDGEQFCLKYGLPLLAHGPAARVGRLRGYGNAIIAQAAKAFIEAHDGVAP